LVFGLESGRKAGGFWGGFYTENAGWKAGGFYTENAGQNADQNEGGTRAKTHTRCSALRAAYAVVKIKPLNMRMLSALPPSPP
jgi:hypothetical protein